MHVSFTDRRALVTTEARHGKRNAAALCHIGPRVWNVIESFGAAPFHIDQINVIEPRITIALVQATIHYINHSDNPIYIECKRFARVMRWVVHYGDKQALQVRAMQHVAKSRRPRHDATLDAEIEEL